MIILSAKYANSEGTAVIVATDTDPSKLLTPETTPDLWLEMEASEVEIEAYVEPDPQAYPTEAIIQSPSGTAFKITVEDDGALATEPIT